MAATEESVAALMAAGTPAERLAALRGFTEFWLGPTPPLDVELTQALATATLPAPLRQLYEFLGPRCRPLFPGHGPSFGKQDQIRSVTALDRTAAGMIRFLDENQGVWCCQTRATGDDPPVWASSTDPIDDAEATASEPPVDPSLSRFLVTFVLQELVFTARVVIGDDDLYQRFRAERAAAVPVWTLGRYVTGAQDYFLWHGVLVLEQGGDAWFAANHDAAVAWLRANQMPITGLTLSRRPWSLVVGADGSATVHRITRRFDPPRRGRFGMESAAVPAGTVDFAPLLAQVQGRLAPQLDVPAAGCVAVAFTRRGNTSNDEPQSLTDPDLAATWFQYVLAQAGEVGATLESLFAQEWAGSNLGPPT